MYKFMRAPKSQKPHNRNTTIGELVYKKGTLCAFHQMYVTSSTAYNGQSKQLQTTGRQTAHNSTTKVNFLQTYG